MAMRDVLQGSCYSSKNMSINNDDDDPNGAIMGSGRFNNRIQNQNLDMDAQSNGSNHDNPGGSDSQNQNKGNLNEGKNSEGSKRISFFGK